MPSLVIQRLRLSASTTEGLTVGSILGRRTRNPSSCTEAQAVGKCLLFDFIYLTTLGFHCITRPSETIQPWVSC